MKLSEKQIQGIKKEVQMYLAFDPDLDLPYSKYMWNNHKKAVGIEFRDGEILRVTEK
jgi:hypothetical protein